jgi:two-component system sensor histidine kinase QseC
MTTITPFLWFDDDAEEAAEFYSATFPDSRILETSRYGEGAHVPAGTLMTATIELAGQRLMLLNAGPAFPHTEAFSLFVECDGQEEVDRYWDALLAGGGEPSMCGWLKDRFGLSWQIVPSEFIRLSADPDPAKASAVVGAMLQMTRFDVAALQAAYDAA